MGISSYEIRNLVRIQIPPSAVSEMGWGAQPWNYIDFILCLSILPTWAQSYSSEIVATLYVPVVASLYFHGDFYSAGEMCRRYFRPVLFRTAWLYILSTECIRVRRRRTLDVRV